MVRSVVIESGGVSSDSFCEWYGMGMERLVLASQGIVRSGVIGWVLLCLALKAQ